MSNWDVRNAENYVNQAQNLLNDYKRQRERAKANGNYKNSSKCYNHNGKVGNVYDSNVWSAEDNLKQRKEELKRAKERAKQEEKKERERAKEDKARAKEDKLRDRESKTTSRNSSSSLSSSSSSYSSSSDSCSSSSSSSSRQIYRQETVEERLMREVKEEQQLIIAAAFKSLMEDGDKLDEYEIKLKKKYRIERASEVELTQWLSELAQESRRLKKEAKEYQYDSKGAYADSCKEVIDRTYRKVSKQLKSLKVESYEKSLNNSYPIDKASDAELAQWIPQLLNEINKQESECKKNKFVDTAYQIHSECKKIAKAIATRACKRLMKLNRSLYSQPNIQEIVKNIDPSLCNPLSQFIHMFIVSPINWIKTKFKAMDSHDFDDDFDDDFDNDEN